MHKIKKKNQIICFIQRLNNKISIPMNEICFLFVFFFEAETFI